jgi:UDP-N-acetylglucosamine 2-epimerase (hydrolysing)
VDVKKILFLTGTRADFSKLQSLMRSVERAAEFKCQVFITGMHTLQLYGYTANAVLKAGFKDTHIYMNQHIGDGMEMVLASTIQGLSRYIHEQRPDMIVIHGDRVEALAGAIVGALTNTVVCHVEGGERSGTVDESLRHAVSKLSHLHFVANDEAALRLRQMGEATNGIHVIGSPDLDVMTSQLPSIESVKRHYEIDFDDYGIVLFHPVTTDKHMARHACMVVDGLLATKREFVVIYPNNDEGTRYILSEYERLRESRLFRLFPSIDFEKFLTLLKHSRCLIGNSSAGIREAPFYGLPSVNIGDRQSNRYMGPTIRNCGYESDQVAAAINEAFRTPLSPGDNHFGDGNSAERFIELLRSESVWIRSTQKQFNDVPLSDSPPPGANS